MLCYCPVLWAPTVVLRAHYTTVGPRSSSGMGLYYMGQLLINTPQMPLKQANIGQNAPKTGIFALILQENGHIWGKSLKEKENPVQKKKILRRRKKIVRY